MENFTTQHEILCCGKKCISSVLHCQWMIRLFLVVTVLNSLWLSNQWK